MFMNNILPNNVYIYQYWEKFGNMGVTSRTGFISLIYEKGNKEDMTNYRPISLLNLDYHVYTTILKNQLLSKKDLYYIHFLP